MRGNEFLDKMELVDAAFIEEADSAKEVNFVEETDIAETADFAKEADKRHVKKRYSWVKWGSIAAVFCVAFIGAFSVWNAEDTKQPILDLEPITLQEFSAGGMGFEGRLYYDASEMENGNPWNEDMEIATLPVYRNNAFDASGAGVPKGLSKEEMGSLLDTTAESLGVTIVSVEVSEGTTTETGAFLEVEREVDVDDIRNGAWGTVEGESTGVTELLATTDNGEISVYADGWIRYFLPDEGIALPEEYNVTDEATDEEAYETLSYLCDVYSKFLDMDNPVIALRGEYSINGTYRRYHTVYDASENDVENILNYNLCSVSFGSSFQGKLSIIHKNNDLLVAEKIGDYPIISAKEARKRLLNGNYQTSVPYEMPGKKYIAKVELVYRTGRLEEMLIPYYRFYVLLPEEERENGLQSYGAYYVPAIADEYIVNMSVYDGHFN